MFQITTGTILEHTTGVIYIKGQDYFHKNKVKAVQFNQQNRSFDATVQGTKPYDVHVEFDTDGRIDGASCSCPAFESYPGYCKHIIAVLLLIQDRDKHGFFSQLNFRQAAKQIFSFFQARPSAVKIPVDLEVTYEFKKESWYNGGLYSALSLRMGEDKLYMVRSIKKFFEAIEKNEEIVFGKNFTFDPLRHDFRHEDRPLINYLKEVYQTEKLVDELSYGTHRGSIFKDKSIRLTNSGVKRFFEIFKDRPFKASILENFSGNISVCNEDFPLEFNLSRESNDLLLSIDFENHLVPLTDDGDYFYAHDKIYKVSKQQQENFKPFFMTIAYQQTNKLRFIEADKERFISEILPFAEKAGKLHIDEKVQSIIEKIPLETEIYLDRSGNSITGEVKFVYGERIINPFAPIDKSAYAGEKILLRDVAKEGLILDILAQSAFKVKSNRIHLNENDDIYDFVLNVIPKLQENATVYYSDSFKNMTIRTSLSFSGKVKLNTETDMLEFSFSMEGIDHSELAGIFHSLKAKKRYYQLKNGSFLNLDSREVNKISDFLEYLDLGEKDFEKELIEIPKIKALYLDQSIRDSGLHYVERNHAFKEFVQNVKEPSDMEFGIPDGINGTLREYQKFGFKWLKTLSTYKLGGILADDMGLGKTLQVITLLLSEKKEKGPKPSLIVVPTSLVFNWCAEMDKFAPELKYLAVSGSKIERDQQLQSINEYDVVITSYPLIRRDIEKYNNYRFRYCILDEAQHIKNPHSRNAQSVKKIRSEMRYALTGTPMENNLSELWSIFDFVLPAYLYSHTKFTEKYENPIVKGSDGKPLEELGKQIRPFILRRLKNDVLDELPEKIENKVVAELSDEQKKVYLAYLQQIKGEIQKEIEEKGFERSHIKILSGLTRLRQICCHPRLFLDNYNGESGKLLLLQEVIQDSIEGGHRILLFSQFTGMLKVIADWLKTEKIDYLYLDGSTPTEERGKLVKAFNEGRGKIFLISLKAGGTGLNLTGADTVIHYDPWWNPAVEDQATDRAYRIGQKKSVHVMKLITKGTIEEKIFKLQEKKKELIDAVIQPGQTLLTKMTQEELSSLFE